MKKYSETLKAWQRVPLNYNYFGEYEISEQGYEKYDELISSQIPEELSWVR